MPLLAAECQASALWSVEGEARSRPAVLIRRRRPGAAVGVEKRGSATPSRKDTCPLVCAHPAVSGAADPACSLPCTLGQGEEAPGVQVVSKVSHLPLNDEDLTLDCGFVSREKFWKELVPAPCGPWSHPAQSLGSLREALT